MPSDAIWRAQHDGGVQVREGGRRRRVREVVRGHVDRLHGGDGPGLGRGDALLEHAHLFRERRLVAHRGRHAAEQRGHFGARERVAVDVVDEEQHVAALAARLLLVAEIFRHRQAGQADAQATARRLVHLAVHHRDLGVRQVLLVDDARFHHLVIEVVALAGALADAREHGKARVRLGDVVDEFEHVDGLADAGAAEEADLAALRERREQVDDLDAGLEQVLAAGLLVVGRRRAVDRQEFVAS